ncbi:MAG: DNA-processing protein DprA [Cyanobacteriota bacterium]|nr:DNA-processing protein DprA [Cyanobacteriota bacterium]
MGRSWGVDERLWWLLWAAVPGLGVGALRQLAVAFGSLQAAWAAPPEALQALPGLGPARLAAIARHRARWGADPLPAWRAAGGGGRGLLLPGDPAMPPAITALGRPPLALYWSGCGSLWAPLRRQQAVAVVGTRRPSAHGLAMAEAIGVALADAGWPVVSGLAEGIDAAVHRGCLRAGGRPVAVLGTALERVYPRHHQALQQQVGRAGLLISEQAPGAAVLAGHFAARNRLQVALAGALVLVECPQRSGALHSARLARDLGMPLWVVPADAAKASAAGSNALLGQGVAPLLAATDLVRALGVGPLPPREPAARARCGTPGPPADVAAAGSHGAEALLAAVGSGATLLQLSEQLDRSSTELLPQLLALELSGRLQAQPGLCWRPA